MFEHLKDEKRMVFRNLDRIIIATVGVLFLLYLLSGIYQVQANEQAVVRRFGEFQRIINPGINYGLPWPVDKVDKIKIKEIKRIKVGFWSEGPVMVGELLPYAITGDKNIIHNQYVIQYRITDPRQYLFSAKKPEEVLLQMANRIILKTVAGKEVDPILTTGKGEVERQIQKTLQDALSNSSLGISVSNISTAIVEPPENVISAFKEVTNAREERSTAIHEANNYRNKIIPEANAMARNLTMQAKSYKYQRTSAAKGESKRFMDLDAEYKQSPRVTRNRLFLEMLDEMLPQTKVVLAATDDKGRPVKLNLIKGALPTRPRI